MPLLSLDNGHLVYLGNGHLAYFLMDIRNVLSTRIIAMTHACGLYERRKIVILHIFTDSSQARVLFNDHADVFLALSVIIMFKITRAVMACISPII